MSARVTGTSAAILGSIRSKTVAPAYMTQPGQAHDGRAVLKIAEQEHRARQDRRAVGDDICTSRLDAARENLAAVIGALEYAMHMITAEGHDETRK